MKECLIDIKSIAMITDFKAGVVKGIKHQDGSYDYQVGSVQLGLIEPFEIKLRKAKTYEEALVIIREQNDLW